MLQVERASGVFPGRTIVVLDDVRFGAPGGRAGLEGGIKFETRDTKNFLRWTLPAATAWLDTVPNGFKGASSMTGRIAADESSVAVKDATLALDGMNVTGSVSVAPGGRAVVVGLTRYDEEIRVPMVSLLLDGRWKPRIHLYAM